MKAMLLTNDLYSANTVYGDEQIKRLKSLCDLQIEAIDCTSVEYIFSTWGMPSFSTDEIRTRFPALKGVFYAAGSVKSFAREFLICGIPVYSAWRANAVPVAEYTFAQILLALKGFFTVQRTHEWNDRKHRTGVYDAKIGICGGGAIGRLVAQKLQTVNCKTYIYDKYLSENEISALGAQKQSLSYIFENCDVITNHLANVPELLGVFDYKLFSKMKPYSTFINTGRGAQVIENDLARAMTEDNSRLALLDVTDPEPTEPGNPLLRCNNVIITPHIAGSISNECRRMADYMIDEFERVISGEPAKHEITLGMLDTMA